MTGDTSGKRARAEQPVDLRYGGCLWQNVRYKEFPEGVYEMKAPDGRLERAIFKVDKTRAWDGKDNAKLCLRENLTSDFDSVGILDLHDAIKRGSQHILLQRYQFSLTPMPVTPEPRDPAHRQAKRSLLSIWSGRPNESTQPTSPRRDDAPDRRPKESNDHQPGDRTTTATAMTAEQGKARSNPLGFFKGRPGSPAPPAPEIEAYRQKIIAREQRMKAWLDTMRPTNPIRLVGEHVYSKGFDHGSLRLGRMIRNTAHEQQARETAQARQQPNRGRRPERDRDP